MHGDRGEIAASNGGPASTRTGIDVFWIPLGAGGSGFVRMNGKIYEAITARRRHRPALSLFHTALQVRVPDGRYVVETMWPMPDRDGVSRGVVVTGPVGSPWLGSRVFRYEVRRWKDGVLPDADQAIGGPQRIDADPERAQRLLDLVTSVPKLVWGRDESGVGEMWNSNSVIAWLLTRSGLPVTEIQPPAGGRAPGWDAGIVIARLG